MPPAEQRLAAAFERRGRSLPKEEATCPWNPGNEGARLSAGLSRQTPRGPKRTQGQAEAGQCPSPLLWPKARAGDRRESAGFRPPRSCPPQREAHLLAGEALPARRSSCRLVRSQRCQSPRAPSRPPSPAGQPPSRPPRQPPPAQCSCASAGFKAWARAVPSARSAGPSGSIPAAAGAFLRILLALGAAAAAPQSLPSSPGPAPPSPGKQVRPLESDPRRSRRLALIPPRPAEGLPHPPPCPPVRWRGEGESISRPLLNPFGAD